MPLTAARGRPDTVANRSLDVLVSAAGPIASVPFRATISAGILLADGWPSPHAQQRIGRHGRVFGIWEFRSMIAESLASSEET